MSAADDEAQQAKRMFELMAKGIELEQAARDAGESGEVGYHFGSAWCLHAPTPLGDLFACFQLEDDDPEKARIHPVAVFLDGRLLEDEDAAAAAYRLVRTLLPTDCGWHLFGPTNR